MAIQTFISPKVDKLGVQDRITRITSRSIKNESKLKCTAHTLSAANARKTSSWW